LNSPGLRFLAPAGGATSLRTLLDVTRDAVQFFGEKTGKAYSGALYTQVFTHGRPEQENANLTLLAESYNDSLQKQPDDLWLLAHELAHQWYAVQIQCLDWSDFWLNEGMATFLADAYLEHRFGRQRYEKEIEQSRTLYEGLKSQGQDRSLSFHNWTTTQEASGRIPYHKGAYVLDLLRRHMGDDAFWRGLRLYTRDNWNQSVTSEDLQNAMQAAAGKSLTPFFEQWVYSPR
jgi:aminopeptidase N